MFVFCLAFGLRAFVILAFVELIMMGNGYCVVCVVGLGLKRGCCLLFCLFDVGFCSWITWCCYSEVWFGVGCVHLMP